jgi:hypothetical protein
MSDPLHHVWIDYTNHRGKRAWRRIVPLHEPLSFENNEWHPQSQWIMNAIDLDKHEIRSFALASIHEWRMTRPEGIA